MILLKRKKLNKSEKSQSSCAKKVLASVFIIALMASMMCGCHGSEGINAFEMPEEFDANKEYNIVFWAKNDTNITQVNIYKKAIEDFEKIYPNIHVSLKTYTDYRIIYNDVITNIATNTTPNICISYPDHIATYMTGKNVVVPLDELVSNDKYGLGGSEIKYEGPTNSEMISKFMDELIIDGKLYALPYMRSTEALYINKTYVEKLGYKIPDVPTWDWIWEVSEAALRQNEDGTYWLNGQTVMIPFIYKSTDNMMITELYQRGAEYSSKQGDILLFNDDAKDIMLTVAAHAKTGAFSTFKISSYPGNFLNAGQCIFGIDSTAGASWMGSGAGHQDISADKIVKFETVVRPIPQYDTENPTMISQGPSLCIFNKSDSGEVLASWIFAQYLLTNDVQIAYAQTEGYSPVTYKAIESAEYNDYLSRAGEDSELYYKVKIDATKLLLDNIDNTFITPVFNGSASVRDAAGELIETAAYATRRKLTVDDEFIEKTFSDVQALYRLDQLGQNSASVGKKEFGALPKTAKILLVSMAIAWLLIAVYAILRYNSKVKKTGQSR